MSQNINFENLVSSQSYYQTHIKQSIDLLKQDKDLEQALKKVILFIKYAFSNNGAYRKKYFCLHLIKDIAANFKSQFFRKFLDQSLPSKLLKFIQTQIMPISSQSKNLKIDDQDEYSEKVLKFAVQTISYWSKKLGNLSIKSNFSQCYEELKKMDIQIPKKYQFYQIRTVLDGMWGQKDDQEQQFVKNQEMIPLLSELHDKYNDCRALIAEKLGFSLANDQDLYLKDILEKIRQFLLLFFSRYKALEQQPSIDRDVLVVYFHIMNNLFKKLANRIYIPTFQMIGLTKQMYQANNPSDFNTIDRMEIVNLAGIQKYNALTIFQRIHQRIQDEQKKLGVCQLSIQQQQIRDKERDRERDREALKKNSKEKMQVKKPEEKKLLKSRRI